MNSTRHLIISSILLTLIIIFGTFGYMTIEGWSLLDSVYMTIITLTTVGFGEVHNISQVGRLYTILVIFLGGSFFVYVAGAIVQFMVEGRIRTILGRRRLDKKIDQLKNHYIICGYGRIGRVLCNKLRDYKSINLVVVDNNPELVSTMDEDGILYLAGDATDETILIKAGIERAKVLVAVLATDTHNVFLVLTARQINPNILIIARSTHKESEKKLKAAGANIVESPYDIGAVSMAQRILRPTVTNFLDLALTRNNKDIQMEEIPVSEKSKLANIMLKDSGIRQKFNLILIAIKKADGSMIFNPSYESVFRAGDTVIAVGRNDNLIQFEKALNPD
ncbi:MAG: potassium channel protein [Proteobacteria bacterium]|nr:potassium channel protein [Pseudomonadota bacterium]